MHHFLSESNSLLVPKKGCNQSLFSYLDIQNCIMLKNYELIIVKSITQNYLQIKTHEFLEKHLMKQILWSKTHINSLDLSMFSRHPLQTDT